MLPEGNYKVVYFAMDLARKKLIDGSFQLGAFFHPDKIFSYYIIPYRQISPSSVRAHGIKVLLMTNYRKNRILKNIRTQRILKTNNEIFVWNEFIEWMKKLIGDNTDGIILAYHDYYIKDMIPFLIDALCRYNLIEDFFGIVKGFVSCHAIVFDKLESKEHPITLKSLLRKVLEYDEAKVESITFESAKKRARLTYMLMSAILKTDGEIPSNLLKNYVTGRDEEMENFDKQKVLAHRVRSLHAIFDNEFRIGRRERSRAVVLRHYLIDKKISYEELQNAFDIGSRNGILALIGLADTKNIVATKTKDKRKKRDLEDLADLVAAHFTNVGIKADVNANGLIVSKEIGAGEPTKV